MFVNTEFPHSFSRRSLFLVKKLQVTKLARYSSRACGAEGNSSDHKCLLLQPVLIQKGTAHILTCPLSLTHSIASSSLRFGLLFVSSIGISNYNFLCISYLSSLSFKSISSYDPSWNNHFNLSLWSSHNMQLLLTPFCYHFFRIYIFFCISSPTILIFNEKALCDKVAYPGWKLCSFEVIFSFCLQCVLVSEDLLHWAAW
jgi:hypothetical protein